jgi:hypothetical protein
MDTELPFPPNAIIEAYKKDVDLSLLLENLRRTPQERIEAMMSMLELSEALRAGVRSAQ